ncbi:MAG: regulatory protein RecX [Gammaproteobacteria bacterium]|nr:regulatory protein RecX [Gammaproteobacteria bacterium]
MPNNILAVIEGVALRLLAQREHTQQELCQKLKRRGYLQDEILLVLAKLTQEGWQSDARFVELYVAERAGKGYGPLNISQALQQRGVSEALIETFLAKNDVDWSAYLKQIYFKKFKQIPPVDFKEKAQHIRFLQSRGFELDQISGVVDFTA